jgi:6,7-dimethyl-8-ribityllumazine synthase
MGLNLRLSHGAVTEGVFDARGLKFAVVARFNGFITDRLLAGALDALARMGGGPTMSTW